MLGRLNWLIGGIVAALVVPGLAIGLGLPFWLACVVGLLTGGGAMLLFSQRQPFEGLDIRRIGRGRIEFARQLLDDATPLVDRLQIAAKSIKTRAVADRIGHLAETARAILKSVETDPLKIDPVRRFITYYLPRAAEMAEAFALIERQITPRPDRLTATKDIIDRLDRAFTRYSDSLVEADLGALDIELKLLKSSLDEDVGPESPVSMPAVSPATVSVPALKENR